MCVNIFENHVDRKDLGWQVIRKSNFTLSLEMEESPGIEMVIALLLSAIIVRTISYCTRPYIGWGQSVLTWIKIYLVSQIKMEKFFCLTFERPLKIAKPISSKLLQEIRIWIGGHQITLDSIHWRLLIILWNWSGT